MRLLLIALMFVTIIFCGQKPPETPQKVAGLKLARTPSVGLLETAGVSGVVDTDLYDQQKYIEQSDGNTSDTKAKRAAHEAALAHELFAGFNAAKDCDGIIFQGEGDQKPQFSLQIMVDTHDTPGQKPVWVWVLHQTAPDKIIGHGDKDSSTLAAKDICLAVSKAAQEAQLKASRPSGSGNESGRK